MAEFANLNSVQYSIIICTLNRSDVLERCLQTHFDLEEPFDASREYIIVDNGSTDDTASVVKRFSESAKWPVHYIFESRPGHSIALNRGCEAATGTHLVFTDDDAIPATDWLVEMDRCFREMQADWVFGPVFPVWGELGQPRWFGRATGGLLACFDFGNETFVSSDPKKSFAGVNHACRSEAIKSLGLYDEKLGLRGEETFGGNDDDLYRKALEQGYRIIYCPEVSVRHLIADTRLGKRGHLKKAWLLGRSQALNMKTDQDTPSLLGTPRYIYRLLAEHLFGWVRSVFSCNHANAFSHRLRVTRFAAMIWTKFRKRSS